MKRLLSLVLILLLVSSLALAGETPAQYATLTDSPYATLGDALRMESEIRSSAWTDTRYVYVFCDDGKPMRVYADITPEISDSIDGLFNLEDDYEQELISRVGDVPVTRTDDLSVGIPTQEELDALVGLKGQDLLDRGYESWGCEIGDTQTVFFLVDGLYQYRVTFEEPVEPTDDFDEEAALAPLTVASVEFDTVSDYCTDLNDMEDAA